MWQDCFQHPLLFFPWCAASRVAEVDVDFPERLCQLTQLQQLRARASHNPTNIEIWASLPAAFSQLRQLRQLEIACLGLQEVSAAITGAVGLAMRWLPNCA